MTENKTVLPDENVGVLGHIVRGVALAGILTMLVSLAVLLVLMGIGGLEEAAEVVRWVMGISLVVGGIFALTGVQFWPYTNESPNNMPDSTKNNGVP